MLQRPDFPLHRCVAALWLAVIPLLAGCELLTGPGSGSDRAPPEITELPRTLTTQELEVLGASNAFGFDLLREIVRNQPDSSHFLSPLSASMALGMTLNGAANETFDAMRSTLRFDGLSRGEINASYRGLIDMLDGLDPRVSFQLANSVWHDAPLTPREAFVASLLESFDAEVHGIDFGDPEAAPTINAWVDEKTNGRIEEIVPDPIPPLVVMYLLNAIHFKGDWTSQFDPDDTHNGDFLLPDGSSAPVRYMTREGGFRVHWTPGYTVLDLPYGGKAFSMTVVVPHAPDGLPDLVESLDAAGWADLVDGLGGSVDRSRIYLPRFTLEWERSLVETLGALGMEIAFQECVADFSLIFEDQLQCPHLSDVVQKTFVRVDEEGTEAAAVTSVEVSIVSAPPAYRVDRPFLFAIREHLSGTILFLGAISEPPTD